MAIILVQEALHTPRETAVNDQRERTYTRAFNVFSTTTVERPDVVRLASGIPRVWDPYVDSSGIVDPFSWCRDVRVRQDGVDPTTWRVTCSYSNKVERPDINQQENPLLRPAEISWDSTHVMIPLERDSGGDAITNSAGERFDPPPEIEDYRLTLTIVKNQPLFDARLILRYQGRVNSHPWYGLDAGTVRCTKIAGSRKFENGKLYWQNTYAFEIKEPKEYETSLDCWAFKLLDRGFFTLDESSSPAVLRVALDPTSLRPYSAPILLDGAGQRLPNGDPPVFISWFGYQEADFNLLGLV